MGNRVIELKKVKKSYGTVFAIGRVNMRISQGEVVGLIGDNGAGKSTRIKILSGLVRPTSGVILVGGTEVHGQSVGKSRAAGIETVFQHCTLAVQQTILRNIFIGRFMSRKITTMFGLLDIAKQRSKAVRLMREIGFTSKVFSPDSIVGQLSGGERQGVAIARAS